METIQERVAKTLLQQKTKIKIGGQEFKVEQPTLATIVKVGELVSHLPETTGETDKNTLYMVEKGKDIEIVAEIICTLVLGVKKSNRLRWWQIFDKASKRRLKDWVMENATPSELAGLVAQIIGCLQLNDFFLLSTSLKGIMMTKPTRGVEN